MPRQPRALRRVPGCCFASSSSSTDIPLSSAAAAAKDTVCNRGSFSSFFFSFLPPLSLPNLDTKLAANFVGITADALVDGRKLRERIETNRHSTADSTTECPMRRHRSDRRVSPLRSARQRRRQRQRQSRSSVKIRRCSSTTRLVLYLVPSLCERRDNTSASLRS